ncbi:MAG: right-handed parallel beta-helix repeat-containing protein [Ferruginibacter sp.]
MKLLLLGLFPLTACLAVPPLILKPGLVIRQSAQVKKDTYALNAPDSLNQPLILVEGNNITVDFAGAELKGSNNTLLPNQYYGLALLIRGNNITIKNAVIKGYKVAVWARGCQDLRIENCNFSYNYRQRLQSTWQGEDVSDWMSYHHNENGEWLRYGAGIYLEDCNNARIRNNIITGGQCALMIVRSNNGLVNDNDFSFNSGIGIGMYRSSHNKIMHNKLDFNVRGYSHGFYNRGQDSAGILVFEQCNENLFAYNSVTHGGDGFFLWAGQTTMDKGSGGCNDNYLVKNDFSYAPTNGIEVTFSKNHILDNIVNECDHGIWGGYSWQTSIENNTFYKNRIGIAIEHGQDIDITGNRFNGNKEAIRLWARKNQPADWGYARHRDTWSRNYNIRNNVFGDEPAALNITLTDQVKFVNNTPGALVKKDSSVTNFITEKPAIDTPATIPAIIRNWKNKMIPSLKVPAGKEQIRITEWGPYDYRYPLILLKKTDSNKVYYFDVLGPGGSWQINHTAGLSNISQASGDFPAKITASKTGDDVWLEILYKGPEFTDAFGRKQPGSSSFSFREYSPEMNWDVKWYKWDAAHDPVKAYTAFKTYTDSATAIKKEYSTKLNYTWWGAIGKQLPADSFATVATTSFNIKKGRYELGVTADDLVKVYLDGKLVIDFWDASKYVYDEDAHHSIVLELGGTHHIRIEQVENSGFATLIFSLKPL